MNREVDKSEIRRFWEENSLMSGEILAEPGSKQFFEMHERMYGTEIFPKGGIPDYLLPFPDRCSVLDIGCGPGIWTRELARRGYHVLSMDLTATAVRLTRRSLALFGLSAQLLQADAEALPLKDNSIDGIISTGVIHHTPNTAGCVKEMARVLKTDGFAVLSVYYRNLILRSWILMRLTAFFLSPVISLPGRKRENLLSQPNSEQIVRVFDGGDNPLGKAYTADEFEGMFRAAGLNVIAGYRYYFPRRAFGRLAFLLKPFHAFFSSRYGLMYAVIAQKTKVSDGQV
jgi:2-polyprenyl-3-methyl-5-hydroxy-6-metoxy-1,4-benzoquinol methylase